MLELSEAWKLLLVILLPPLLAFLLVIVFIKEDGWKRKMRAALTLYPEYGLIKQAPLWLSIIIPFFYFIGLGVFAWKGYEVSLTAKGLETFWNISKFPLLVLSVSIPLTGLVSRIHSTEQTAKQIKLVMHKNNLDAFYAHRKELFSYFSQIGEVDYQGEIKAKFKVYPKIHKIFFKGLPSEGTPEVNNSEFQGIETTLMFAKRYIHDVTQDVCPEKTFDDYINVCGDIYTLGEKLGLPEITVQLAKKSVHVPYGKGHSTTVGVTTDELVEAYYYALNYFLNLCDFASYTPNKELKKRLCIGSAGDKYKNIKQPLVVERLHETFIKELIANKTL
ncbi:MAG: hypothetical protein LUO95_11745 [Methylococcaceae bacterium]|nr:hypothetical protein [Methylococcaceae bacterium]